VHPIEEEYVGHDLDFSTFLRLFSPQLNKFSHTTLHAARAGATSLRKLFNTFDDDSDGFIPPEDFPDIMQTLGVARYSQNELIELAQEVAHVREGGPTHPVTGEGIAVVDFAEALNLIVTHDMAAGITFNISIVDDQWERYRLFLGSNEAGKAAAHAGQGATMKQKLGAEDLGKAMNSLGLNMTEEEIEEIILGESEGDLGLTVQERKRRREEEKAEVVTEAVKDTARELQVALHGEAILEGKEASAGSGGLSEATTTLANVLDEESKSAEVMLSRDHKLAYRDAHQHMKNIEKAMGGAGLAILAGVQVKKGSLDQEEDDVILELQRLLKQESQLTEEERVAAHEYCRALELQGQELTKLKKPIGEDRKMEVVRASKDAEVRHLSCPRRSTCLAFLLDWLSALSLDGLAACMCPATFDSLSSSTSCFVPFYLMYNPRW